MTRGPSGRPSGPFGGTFRQPSGTLWDLAGCSGGVLDGPQAPDGPNCHTPGATTRAAWSVGESGVKDLSIWPKKAKLGPVSANVSQHVPPKLGRILANIGQDLAQIGL